MARSCLPHTFLLGVVAWAMTIAGHAATPPSPVAPGASPPKAVPAAGPASAGKAAAPKPVVAAPGAPAAPSGSRATIAAPADAIPGAAPPPPAVNPDRPYAATVPAESESDAALDKGLRDAMKEVLRFVVGRDDDPAFAPIVARAGLLVQQYGFKRDPATDTLQFFASFDARSVEDTLRAQGLPVLGVDLSIIEAWVVEVHGVTTPSAYGRLLDYLERLRGVRRVDVDQLREDALTLRLTVEGGVAHAQELVAAGGVLRPNVAGGYDLVN